MPPSDNAPPTESPDDLPPAVEFPCFLSASGYQGDALALPVKDIEDASLWYRSHFGMIELERIEGETPTVILQRDEVSLGFAVSGGDASQDGAAIRVCNIEQIRNELSERGVAVGDLRTDEHDDGPYRVFFVVAPDGLCFYFNEPMD